jgi:hypothetical protein
LIYFVPRGNPDVVGRQGSGAVEFSYSAVATSSHRGMARGFLPRALSNTRPQTSGMRSILAALGQVSNKPKQEPPFVDVSFGVALP